MDIKHPLSEDLDYILSQTESLFQELRNKKIFLTGGTGFFGKWILESFIWANLRLELNAQMHVLSRDPQIFKAKYPYFGDVEGVIFHKGDVRTFDFPVDKIDFVIHAATDVSPRLNRENPLLVFDTIIEGTRRVLDFSIHCNAKRFLLTSSGAVYGEQPSDLLYVPEDYSGSPDTTQPSSVYGECKRTAELLCSIYNKMYRIETVIARCFAFVGPYLPLNGHYAVGNFIRDGLLGNRIIVHGDGTPLRSYMYSSDLVVWLWTLLFRGKSCEAYNVGSEDLMTIRDLAYSVASQFVGKSEVVILKKSFPGQNAIPYVPSVKKAREDLNLRCLIDLKTALQKTIQWNQTYMPE